MTSRRAFILGAGAAALAACGERPGYEGPFLEKAAALIAARPSLDLHAHPGRSFVRGARHLAPAVRLFAARGHFERRVIDDMRAAGLTGAVFSAVADFQLLDLVKGGPVSRRPFEAGEARASYERQIANLNRMFSTGMAEKILAPSDLPRIKEAGAVGAMIGVEGGDFLEGSVERVAEAFADGVRCINPVHYHTNELGDIMTEAPTHNGLTEAGERVIRAMNEAGVIVDVAHASEKTAFGIMEATERPVICSHTHIRTARFDSPRFISLDLAREVVAAGGVIGAWPAGIGITDIAGFVDRILELIDAVGADHVGLGSDMDANYKPVWDNYRQFPEIIARLLERGLSEDETAKVIGGNGLRVFAAV